MAIQFVNCVGTDPVRPSSYYRVVFAISTSIFAAWLVESGKDNALQRAFDAIAANTDLVPTTQYSRAPGEHTVVVDCKAKIHAAQTVAQAASVINQADPLVDMVSLELLTAPPGPQAGTERQALIDNSEHARPAVGGALTGALGGAFGNVTDTVKWVAIAFILVVVVVTIKDAEEWI